MNNDITYYIIQLKGIVVAKIEILLPILNISSIVFNSKIKRV